MSLFNRLISKRCITLALFVFISFTSFCQVRIIMNGGTMKLVNGVYVSTNDLAIANGSVIADSSTIKIAGAISNAGIFDLRNGTLEMNGNAPQTIPANSISYNTVKNLVASNNFNLAGQDSVTGVLSFGASNTTINTGGFLTLKSTAEKTASLADITNAGTTSGNAIVGNVHVERYISAIRAWRLLTAPINIAGAQTINQAWQEGAANPSLAYAGNINPQPGFGMHISGGTAINGFDPGVNSNSAIKAYSFGLWIPLANTKSTLITSQNAFMVFFRGNRSTNLSLGTWAPVTSSVLRSTGSLKTNDQVFTVADTGFTVIGNPYASPISLYQIAKTNSTNVQDNFYLWDPKITGSNGVGGYVNVSWDGISAYDITPSGTGTSGLNSFIQSGSAFLAKSANGTAPGILVIKETDKNTVNLTANRPAGNSTGKLKTNLYSYNADGTISLVDGILNSYDDMFANGIDNYDAVKIKNTNESLFTVRDGKSLVVERKQLITEADTIFVNMLKMQAKSYKFEFLADNFNSGGLTAVLEDSYTNTKTILDLTGATVYNYTVVNVPGSWNPTRFRVVFKQLNVLPVTFTTVKAFEQSDNIKVEWKVENERSIKQYEIEKSADGQQFAKAGIVAATNSTSASTYSWLDKNALEGNNYYRIKSVGINGQINYSAVIKVSMGNDKQSIELITNVISNNAITFQMNNMPVGHYAVSITNNLGQVVYSKKIERDNGTTTESIQLNKNLTTGIYYLNIIQPDFTSLTIKLFAR